MLNTVLSSTVSRVSRVSAVVSVRFSGIWDRRLQVCPAFDVKADNENSGSVTESDRTVAENSTRSSRIGEDTSAYQPVASVTRRGGRRADRPG